LDRISKGKELADSVFSALGRQFTHRGTVEELYDGCAAAGNVFLIEEIAFVAKSYEKLSRLLEGRISDEDARAKVATELENTVARFLQLLERASDYLADDLRSQFKRTFLESSQHSFVEMMEILSDFSILKDYLLFSRDEGNSV